MNTRATRRLGAIVALLMLASCASAPVTQENSIEGKIAHYAIKVQDAKRAIDTSVKQLEAQGLLPTEQAAAVIKRSVELDEHIAKLADLLAAYDAVTAGSQPPPGVTETTAPAILTSIQQQLTRISAIASGLLVPLQQETARQQIAALTAALQQALLNVSLAFAQPEVK